MGQESEAELKAYLQECGILQAWQALLKVIVQNGFPEENVYEFAADEILKFGEEWKKTHKVTKPQPIENKPQIENKFEIQSEPPTSATPPTNDIKPTPMESVEVHREEESEHEIIESPRSEEQEAEHTDHSEDDPLSPPGYEVSLTDEEKEKVTKQTSFEDSDSYDSEEDSSDSSDDLPHFEQPLKHPMLPPSITVTPPSPPVPMKRAEAVSPPRKFQNEAIEEDEDEEVVYVDEDGNIIPEDQIGEDHEIISEDEYLEQQRLRQQPPQGERVIYVDEDGNQVDADDIDDYEVVDEFDE